MDQRSTLPAPDSQPYNPPTPPPPSPMEERLSAEEPTRMTMPVPAQTPAAPLSLPKLNHRIRPLREPYDYSKPVAYDQHGRPLFAHPPAGYPPATPAPVPVPSQPAAAQPQPAKPAEKPAEPSEDARQRHAEALTKYPQLNLSDGEYVIAAIPRDPIGLLQIWAVAIFFFLAIGGFVFALMYGQDVSDTTRVAAAAGLSIVGVLAIAGALVFGKIYHGNKLYLTNESIVQETQTSLIAKREQTVSLGNIQNVSYKSGGYLASLFDFGTIQMATEGEDTNYKFTHVAKPKKQAALINNAVEAFNAGNHND